MARGAQEGLKSQAQGYAGTLFNEGQGMLQGLPIEESPIKSGYLSEVNWGDPRLENTYEQMAEQPAATAVDAIAQNAAARAARTNNAAGFGAEEENLAGQRATQVSQAAQRGFAQYKNQQLAEQQAGLKGLSNLYGIDTNTVAKMLGLPAGYLDVAYQAGRPTEPGFWDLFSSALSGAQRGGGGGGGGSLG